MRNLQILIIVFSLLMGISLVAGFWIIGAGPGSADLGIGVMWLGIVVSGIGIIVAGLKMCRLKEQRKDDRIKKLENEVESLRSELHKQ